jgi:hypothetical protein
MIWAGSSVQTSGGDFQLLTWLLTNAQPSWNIATSARLFLSQQQHYASIGRT